MANILKKQINLQKTSDSTYSAGWDDDWSVGTTLWGGALFAIIHSAAVKHLTTDPALVAQNQPDVMALHVEFLRPCEREGSVVTITTLRSGPVSSTLQLEVSQRNKKRVLAIVTSTNFDKSLGPSAPSGWGLLPPPRPAPDFERIRAQEPDANWNASRYEGELISFTGRLFTLTPRGGHPALNICDYWHGFVDNDSIDGAALSLMVDTVPSLSDALMRNNAPFDPHFYVRKVDKLAEQNPGAIVATLKSMKDALSVATFQFTVSMNIEFKRRVMPEDGVRWLFTRASTKTMKDGRMDVEITICDENLELLVSARQVVLVLETQRKFQFQKRHEKASL